VDGCGGGVVHTYARRHLLFIISAQFVYALQFFFDAIQQGCVVVLETVYFLSRHSHLVNVNVGSWVALGVYEWTMHAYVALHGEYLAQVGELPLDFRLFDQHLLVAIQLGCRHCFLFFESCLIIIVIYALF